MIKTILVPVLGSAVETRAFDAALGLARMFAGHIDFLYARPEPVTASSVYGAAFLPGMLEQMQAVADRQHGAAMRAHLDACEREKIPTDIVGPAAGKVTARWHRAAASVADGVAAQGRTADLIVVPRGRDILTTQALQAGLFESGRPVLIPGRGPFNLETIAIAWKPTREAARAVAAALPLLMRAKRVVVVSMAEGAKIDVNEPERLAAALRRHLPAVETSFLQSDSQELAEALLGHAYHVGASLLVMGAYSRSRLRELMLGGVTESVIDRSELPVFMAH